MIRITNPAHQKKCTVGDQTIILDYCAVKFVQLSIIGGDIYAHAARVMVIWGSRIPNLRDGTGEFVEAQPLTFEEFSLANVREEKRPEFFQKYAQDKPLGPPDQREVITRPADHALRDLLTPEPSGQAGRRFGDVRMRDFEQWLVDSGKIGGVVE